MYIVQHNYKGMRHEMLLFNKMDNAIRSYVEKVRSQHRELKIRVLPQKYTTTKISEEEQEELLEDSTAEILDAQFYIDKPLEFANLMDLVEEHQEFCDHQIEFFEQDAEDMPDQQNKHPKMVTTDPACGPYNHQYKGVRFTATSNKELSEFQAYIDKKLSVVGIAGPLQSVYRHRNYFYYQTEISIKFHILHGISIHVTNTEDEMRKYIDEINNAL